MRLDLVLKLSGLIKRRTIAKELAEHGKVTVNDKVAKPSTEVKNGDVLCLSLGQRKVVVTIEFVQKGRKDYPVYKEVNKG